jgi:hypothetical protein
VCPLSTSKHLAVELLRQRQHLPRVSANPSFSGIALRSRARKPVGCDSAFRSPSENSTSASSLSRRAIANRRFSQKRLATRRSSYSLLRPASVR